MDLGFFIITPFKGKFFVEVEDIGVDSQKTFVAVPSMSVKSVSSVHVSVSSKSSEEQQQLPPSESIENDIISDFLPPIKTPYHLIEPNSPKNKIVPGDSTESEAIQYVV